LEKEDWETAKKEFMQKMPLMLRLQRAERIAWVGDREVHLTPQEHKILLTLADSHGQCGRERLADAVWGTPEGVTQEAIDRAMGRLREKLSDDPSNPIYLVTARGEGFKLLHYEIE
jgi:DNA-binding response OmpR family regulator